MTLSNTQLEKANSDVSESITPSCKTVSILNDTSVERKSSYLSGIKITIVAGGGIAAIELPRLARELRRHGAFVNFFVTENCLKFVGLYSLQWASQNEVILNPSGLAEHICTSDALVVFPATADLISKAKNGICSDGPTTLIQSALGLNKTIIFCPTMHESLSASPIIQENKEYLGRFKGVYFLSSRKEEGKDKAQTPDILAINVSHIINKRKNFPSKIPKVAVTLGGTLTMLDPVRCISNLSTGNLGLEVSQFFYASGIELTIISGHTNFQFPIYEYIEFNALPNYTDMYNYIEKLNISLFSGFINLVAGSDFTCKEHSTNKISSQQEHVSIELLKTKKIIDIEKLSQVPFRFAAKLTSENNELGIEQAKKLLISKNLNSILWNSSETVWSKKGSHSGVILNQTKEGISEISVHNKSEIAFQIYNSFINFLNKSN